jgi:hypothetical protein
LTTAVAEGDWLGLKGSAEGALWVQDFNSDAILADTAAIQTAVEIIDNAVHVDDAAFTLGTDSGMMMMGFAGPQSVNSNDAAALACTTAGALHVNILAQTNDVTIADGGNSITVDNGGTFATQATLQAGSAAIGKLAANSGVDIGDVDILSIAAGDNNIGNVDIASIAAGTNAIGKLAANSGVDIGDVDVTSITGLTMANGGAQITGDEAHDAADAGAPVKIGMKAKAFDGTAPGTNVAEDDRVDAIATLEGRQLVETTHPNFWSASVDYASAQTNATVKAAPGASLKLYITDILLSNGATAGNVTLLDGSGGTVLWEAYPAITGGAKDTRKSPIVLTANTLLAITSTTVTTHSLTVSGYIAA